MLTKAEQDAILVADLQRRHARRIQEDMDLLDHSSDSYKIAHAPKNAHVNPCLVRAIGVVCPPPKTSASENCWNRGMKGTTKGVAPGSTDPTPSMKVTLADGTSYVAPIPTKSKTRAPRVKTTTAQAQPETARIHLDHNFND